MLRQYQEEITRLKTMLERQQVLPITMEIGDQAEVPTVAMSNDEIQRLKQEFIEQHEVKARDLEADRERTVQLQQRLQQEWELVQEERNAIAIHRWFLRMSRNRN
uniref:Uncharacterized protein n=1 Tax=Spongospora subterranea TaxID=70186 RepID=A0A0H5RAE6_9EUKA|eukprot:CRZ10766.1 hypothetical protein [Spongospora subterranea]